MIRGPVRLRGRSRSFAGSISVLLALPFVGAATGAPAADENSVGANGDTALQEIVVSARRKEENLADVPVSVSVLSAQALQEQHVQTEQDLQFVTPGLTVYGTNSSNSLNFSLRGQSVDAFSFAAPAVLTYVNEFSVQSDSASAFYDLDSIQVLKGPQGTLFGRNATGGAVLYQTQKPQQEFGGYVQVGYGNFDDTTAEGALNLPLPGGIGALRFAGQLEKRDGYQHNVLLDIENGSIDAHSGRISLLLTPTSGITSLTVLQYNFSGGYSVGLKADNVYLPGQTNNGVAVTAAIPAGAVYVPGVIVSNPRVQQLGFNGIVDFLRKQAANYGFYDIFDSQTNAHRAKDWLYTNSTTFDISDAFTLKNVVGYHGSDSRDRTDVDGAPYQPLTIGFVDGPGAEGYRYMDDQFSEELQASGKVLDNRLSYIGGLYYFRGHTTQIMELDIIGDLLNPVTLAPIAPAADFLRDYSLVSNSRAAYGQMTYAFTDRMHLTLGGRVTSETIEYKPAVGDEEARLGVEPADQTHTRPSWSVSLDYKLADDWMVYFAQRGSWRSGGFNGTSQNFLPSGQAVAQAFAPETTYDFEVGAKFNGLFLGMPAAFNIALYDQNIAHVIRAIYFNDSANSGNVDKAVVKGLEADGFIKPAPWAQAGFSMAYTDAIYTEPTAAINNTTVIFGPYGDAPKWSGTVYGRVSGPLPDNSEFAARVDYYVQSHFFYSNAAATILPNTEIPMYGLLGGRLEWNNIHGSNVSLAAWGKNLTNKEYFTGGFALGAVTGINSVLEGTPRMYGVSLSVKL